MVHKLGKETQFLHVGSSVAVSRLSICVLCLFCCQSCGNLVCQKLYLLDSVFVLVAYLGLLFGQLLNAIAALPIC